MPSDVCRWAVVLVLDNRDRLGLGAAIAELAGLACGAMSGLLGRWAENLVCLIDLLDACDDAEGATTEAPVVLCLVVVVD